MDKVSIYGGLDPREIPIYSVGEAASYISLPRATLHSWVKGRYYDVQGTRRRSPELISLPPENEGRLTFNNLIEAYVLRALRTKHEVSMSKVRQALVNAQESLGISRLLLIRELLAGRGEIFLNYYGDLINLSSGQIAFLIEPYLERIERDSEGFPSLLYPLIPHRPASRSVIIDARVSFGRPTIEGIATAVILNRYSAGETRPALAQDYRITIEQVEDAIFYELAA